MKLVDLEKKNVEQRNRIEVLEQQNRDIELDVAMNQEVNKMSLEERIKVKYDIDELKEKVNKIDTRLKIVENKK